MFTVCGVHNPRGVAALAAEEEEGEVEGRVELRFGVR
jgi:hypothetical protein